MAPDTLHIDSAQIAVWQDDGRYDYNRELLSGSENLLEWIASAIRQWLNETLHTALDDDVVYYVLVGLGAMVLLIVGWLLWKKRSKLFYGKEDEGEALDYEVVEDSIYGVDFDADLREALERGDYRQAIRLAYLQTLLHLQEAGKIDWQPSKTPAQYMRQFGQPAFTQLTNIFVQVRYGNFNASEALFQQMKTLQEAVMEKGGAADE